MEWVTLLKSLQADFIERLKTGSENLLHCNIDAHHSELTIISGEKLDKLLDFCWQMAEKYKKTSSVRNIFINNLKGKLGEEVVKTRLGNLINEVDYEEKLGGDGKIDFKLTASPLVGIQVKVRYGTLDKVEWRINKQEIENNSVLICLLVQEEIKESQASYSLVMAGFLPTFMISMNDKDSSFQIQELLYGGGLRGYLEAIQSIEPSLQPELFKSNPKSEKSAERVLEDLSNPGTLVSKPIIKKKKSFEYFLEQGNSNSEAKHYEQAIESYNQAIALNPENFIAYYKRGIAFSGLGKIQRAIEDYTHSIKLNSLHAKSYYNRGTAFFELKEYKKAVQDYSLALKVEPHNAKSYYGRASSYSQLKLFEKAIQDCEAAIKVDPNLIDAYYCCSIACQSVGRYPEAIRYCDQAIQLKPNDVNFYYFRGTNYQKIKCHKNAIQDFAHILKQKPTDAEAYFAMSLSYIELEDYKEAMKGLREVIRFNPHHAESYYNQGILHFELGNRDLAIQNLEKAAYYFREGRNVEGHRGTLDYLMKLL